MIKLPKEVSGIIEKLSKSGLEAYPVGGCVRDLLRGVEPKDWDVTTNAKPQQIRKIFPKSFYENKFFTVTVQTGSKEPRLKEVEITTFRSEAKYTDKRHPDQIKFAEKLEEDLKRRDFTINAMALKQKDKKWEVIDPFSGQKDLENKLIRTVGEPEQRFSEDALRLMRAVRFATSLGFSIEIKTFETIREQAGLLQIISKERIRDELMKIVMAERASKGIELLRETGLLKYVVPELEEGYGVAQNKHHIYEVYEHNLRCLDYAARNNYNKYVRLAALLHDIAKPRTKQGKGLDSTFYNHEVVGAKMAAQILHRLKFSKKDIEKVAKLVRYHLFYYTPEEVGESSVRRLVRQVGPENMEELLQVRFCDRIGSGCPKAEPYKLRHLRYVMEKVSQDPISAKTLEVNGDDIMKILKISPGSKVGRILDILLGQVLLKPEKNKRDVLSQKIQELNRLSDKKIENLAKEAREKRGQLEMKKDEMTKKKYWVS